MTRRWDSLREQAFWPSHAVPSPQVFSRSLLGCANSSSCLKYNTRDLSGPDQMPLEPTSLFPASKHQFCSILLHTETNNIVPSSFKLYWHLFWWVSAYEVHPEKGFEYHPCIESGFSLKQWSISICIYLYTHTEWRRGNSPFLLYSIFKITVIYCMNKHVPWHLCEGQRFFQALVLSILSHGFWELNSGHHVR